MQGRLENQLKLEKKIDKMLSEMPKVVSDYYLNFSATREFRSCFEYIQKLRKFLIWYADNNEIELKEVDCTAINDKDIARYMKLIETKETKEGTSYTSFSFRKTNWSILNSFFKYLEEKEKIKKNPMRTIGYPDKKDKVKHKHLKKDDLDKMAQIVIDGVWEENSRAGKVQKQWIERDLAILYTFIFTGMRASALCEIDMENVDLKHNVLIVIDKEHKINTYIIPDKLKSFLVDWIKQRKKILGDINSDALFISNQKTRISRMAVYSMIRKYSKEALGYSISPHRLRAAFCNIIYENTHDIELASRAMRHENIATTRLYIEDDENKVNQKVDDILSNVF